MTAKLYRLRELLFDVESPFLANALTPGSATYTQRVPLLSGTCTLTQEKIPDGTVLSRKNDARPGFNGLRVAIIEFETWWPGMGDDPAAGAAVAGWDHDLLANGLGGASYTDDGGTVSGSPAPTSSVFTTSGCTLTPGGIARVGVKGDGRGDGQPIVVDTFAANVITSLVALPLAPAAADVVRACTTYSPTETGPSGSFQFLMGFTATGAQFHCFGAQLDKLELVIDVNGALPAKRRWTFRAAYWDIATETIPSAVACPIPNTAPTAGGSVALGATGSTTRVEVAVNTLTITLNMGLIPQTGPVVGQPPYTNIFGWVSTGCRADVELTREWTSAPLTDWDLDGSAASYLQLLWASNATAGRVQGVYLPRLFRVGARPTYTDQGELLYVTEMFSAREGTDVTSELTRSNFRIFQG